MNILLAKALAVTLAIFLYSEAWDACGGWEGLKRFWTREGR